MKQLTDEYYTPKELAEMWKMKIGFVRGEIRDGKLQCRHFGRSVRITKEQVTAYIENFTE